MDSYPKRMVALSIVVPVLSELRGVEDLLTQWQEWDWDLSRELLFLSADAPQSPSDLSSLVAPVEGVRWITQTGKGIADAWNQGMRETRGEIVVTMDGDGVHRLAAIPSLVNKVHQGNQLVVAQRTPGANYMPGRRWMDIQASRWAGKVYSTRYAIPLQDPLHGFRARTRTVVEKLAPSLCTVRGNIWMGIECRLAHSLNFSLAQVSIPYGRRLEGRDHKRLRHQVGPFLRELWTPQK